jgi:hypothetical protein
MKTKAIVITLVTLISANAHAFGKKPPKPTVDSLSQTYASVTTAPTADQLAGEWTLIGMLTQQGTQWDFNGLKQQGQLVGTDVFVGEGDRLTVTMNFARTREQVDHVKTNGDHVTFTQGFDSDLKFTYDCKISPADQELVCKIEADNPGFFVYRQVKSGS